MNIIARSTIHPVARWLHHYGAALPWRARWSFSCLPPRCYFCEREGDLGPIDLCTACLAGLPWSPCADPERLPFAAFTYRDPIAESLKTLKYRGDRRAARLFGGMLAGALFGYEPPDALIPVPLHPERVCRRGFNQSALIATHVGYWLDRPVHPDWLSRIRATPSQTGLHAAERRLNVEGAFVVSPCGLASIASMGLRRVALIDDVLTTGATLDAARDALLAAGLVEVQRWAVARAMPTNSAMPT